MKKLRTFHQIYTDKDEREKKATFDYQSFEEQALKAMYEGKSHEQALGPLLKRLVEAGLQGEMQAHLEEEKASEVKIAATARRANRYAADLASWKSRRLATALAHTSPCWWASMSASWATAWSRKS